MPKILIIGYGRHGKDTLAEIWQKKFCMKFQSSSLAVCKRVVMPVLQEEYGYKTIEECYEDRINHRQEWYELICEYNEEDGSRLCREILYEDGNDCYVGMRSKREFLASKHLFDLVIFVDASKRHPPEGENSCTITKEDADIIITNNGTLAEFIEKAERIGNMIF